MKSDFAIDELKHDFNIEVDDFLSLVCDHCHDPFVCDDEILAGHCDNCCIEKSLDTLIRKARTIALGEFLIFTHEEMFKE